MSCAEEEDEAEFLRGFCYATQLRPQQDWLLRDRSELLRRLSNELIGCVYDAIHEEVLQKRKKYEIVAACKHIASEADRLLVERGCATEDSARYHAGVREVVTRDKWHRQEGLERLRAVSRIFLAKQRNSVASGIWDEAVQDVVTSFSRYIAGLSGLPRFKRYGVDHVSIRTRLSDTFGLDGNAVCVSKLELDRIIGGKPKLMQTPFHFRKHRHLPSKASSVTFSREHGRWYVSFGVKVQAEEHAPDRSIGLDFGVVSLIADSRGGFVDGLKDDPEDLKEKEYRQRRLSGMIYGSNRYLKEREKMARVDRRIANKRFTRRHQATAYYAKNYRVVCVEDLQIANMTRSASGTVDQPGTKVAQKRGLNRSLRQQGIGKTIKMLEYKVEQRGGRVVKVNPARTSQTCSSCTHWDPDSRISQAQFKCTKCGFGLNADTNAAKNIERIGLEKLAEPVKVAKPRKRTFTVGAGRRRAKEAGR